MTEKNKGGRPEKLRPCIHCGEKYGARKMQSHYSENHKGMSRGKRDPSLPRKIRRQVIAKCLLCDIYLNRKEMVIHKREVHGVKPGRPKKKVVENIA